MTSVPTESEQQLAAFAAHVQFCARGARVALAALAEPIRYGDYDDATARALGDAARYLDDATQSPTFSPDGYEMVGLLHGKRHVIWERPGALDRKMSR